MKPAFGGHLWKSSKVFSFISVDNFMKDVYSASAFFLSHFHADHTFGLDSYASVKQFTEVLSDGKKKLYCTKLTKSYLMNNDNCKYIPRDCIVGIDTGLSIEISGEVQKENGESEVVYITVESIPTGHVPGAVMFLFENRDLRVLYTGDFRINPVDLPRFKQLHDSDGYVKLISELYIDGTFADLDYPVFPSRKECAEEVSRLAADWLALSPKHEVALSFNYPLAYEFLIIEVSKSLNCKIRIDKNIYETHYAFLPELDSHIFLDEEPYFVSKHRVHVCYRPSGIRYSCKICDKLKYDYNIKELNPVARPFRKFGNECVKSNPADKINNMKKIVIEETKRTKICFSTHCSLEEFVGFVKYIQPKNVYPLCEPEEKSKQLVLHLCRERDFKKLEELCNPTYLPSKKQILCSRDSDGDWSS